jgi:putative membrane protein
MNKAAQGGIAEVQMAQLALNKSTNDQVKQFAQQMIDQHSQANNQLAQLAAQKGVTLPTTIGSKYQKTYDKLSKLSGTAFDKAYLSQAGVKAHKDQVSLFKRESEQAKDPDVKAFATSILPTIEEHLQVAQGITSGKTAGSNTNQPNQSAPDSTTTAPGGGSMTAPGGGGSTTAPGGGSMTAPGGGSMTAPGGGSMTAPGGGSTTAPSPSPGQ